MASPRTSFQYVYIPCDASAPLEELKMAIPEGKEIECLLDTLKDHFRSAQTVGTSDDQKSTFKAQLEKQSGKQIDDRMMDIASRMQMVQPVALLPGGTAGPYASSPLSSSTYRFVITETPPDSSHSSHTKSA